MEVYKKLKPRSKIVFLQVNDVSPESRLLNALLKLINKYFRQHRSPLFYAGMFNVSIKHLNKIAMLHLGKLVSELIFERTLQEAKDLLQFTGYQVQQIAYLLEFEDPAYFCRFFKRETGMTPKGYRRKFKAR